MSSVKGYEARFAIHIPTRQYGLPDIHMVKEVIHYDDGSTKPNIRFIKDFKRPLYITRPDKQHYKQKKETEALDDLLTTSVTQSNLRSEIAKLLGKPWSKESLKELCSSPYVYGTDITSTALILHQYQQRYPDLISPFNIATFDVETDVLHGTEDILMATITYKDQIFTAIHKDFIAGFTDVNEQILSRVRKYIGGYIEKGKYQITLHIAEDVPDLIKAVFDKAHEWKPDYLAIWNMDFDIPKVLSQLEKYKVDPKAILCDPKVPPELRICQYRQGPKKKITASGQVKPINPAEQWHTLRLTASFYVIDAMCVYKRLRLSLQEESSYNLDAILGKELGIRKLHFKEADQYKKLKWHQFMQSNYKLEYVVYNIFDSLSMQELDAKTKDLCLTFPSFCGVTDIEKAKSQPKRIEDAYHFFCLEFNRVLGTLPKRLEEPKPDETELVTDIEGDEETDTLIEREVDVSKLDTLNLRGWICTLPSHLTVPGLPWIVEDPTIRTFIRAFVYDSDMVAAYPSCTMAGNVSKATTRRELIWIEGIEERVFRMQNINMLLGQTNAIEYSTTMFNVKKPHELLASFL